MNTISTPQLSMLPAPTGDMLGAISGGIGNKATSLAKISGTFDKEGARIAETAKELEATFLSLLLKEMRQTLEPESLFAGDQGDVQGGLFDLFLSRHLADTGGIGLAAMVDRQLRLDASTRGINHDTSATVGRVDSRFAPASRP